MMMIATQALTRRFGDLTAVDALTLAIAPGEVFGLLGPNGAGKSTAIKMLTTLLPPTSGDASVAGYDITRRAAEVRRSIGYVPQVLSADGTLTGYENLLVFAKLYDLPRAKRSSEVRAALAFMGLTDAAGLREQCDLSDRADAGLVTVHLTWQPPDVSGRCLAEHDAGWPDQHLRHRPRFHSVADCHDDAGGDLCAPVSEGRDLGRASSVGPNQGMEPTR